MARPSGPHLDESTVLDYLDGRLPRAGAQAVEAHLAAPCAACRERLRAVGALLERLRTPLGPQVPGWLHAHARAAFEPAPRGARVARVAEQLARLLFDSWTAPLPAATRRAVGDVRRLRFALGGDALELECEPEGDHQVALRGRLLTPDPELHEIVVASGRETFRARPDARGAFALRGVPRGRVQVTVTGPLAHWRTRSLPL